MTYAEHSDLLLADRVAVVTGGGGGIGSATARLFARQGAHVVIADIDGELADATADAITASGGSARAVVTDVRAADQVTRLARTVRDGYGRVDVLVNNVGHWLRHPGDFVDTDPQLWDELYQINLHHVFLLTRAFLPAMVERHAGAIVNVSSVEGLRGYPEDPVYAAFNLPEDQARVILFLASDLSAFVTGHTIATDGGTGAAGGWFRSSRRPGRAWTNRPVDP